MPRWRSSWASARARRAVLEALRHPPVGEGGVVDEVERAQPVEDACDEIGVHPSAGHARRQLAARPRPVPEPVERLAEGGAVGVLRPQGRDGLVVQHLAALEPGRHVEVDAERVLVVEVHVHTVLVCPLQLQPRDDRHWPTLGVARRP